MYQVSKPWVIDSDTRQLVRCPLTEALFLETEVFEGNLRWLCPDCHAFHLLPFMGEI